MNKKTLLVALHILLLGTVGSVFSGEDELSQLFIDQREIEKEVSYQAKLSKYFELLIKVKALKNVAEKRKREAANLVTAQIMVLLDQERTTLSQELDTLSLDEIALRYRCLISKTQHLLSDAMRTQDKGASNSQLRRPSFAALGGAGVVWVASKHGIGGKEVGMNKMMRRNQSFERLSSALNEFHPTEDDKRLDEAREHLEAYISHGGHREDAIERLASVPGNVKIKLKRSLEKIKRRRRDSIAVAFDDLIDTLHERIQEEFEYKARHFIALIEGVSADTIDADIDRYIQEVLEDVEEDDLPIYRGLLWTTLMVSHDDHLQVHRRETYTGCDEHPDEHVRAQYSIEQIAQIENLSRIKKIHDNYSKLLNAVCRKVRYLRIGESAAIYTWHELKAHIKSLLIKKYLSSSVSAKRTEIIKTALEENVPLELEDEEVLRLSPQNLGFLSRVIRAVFSADPDEVVAVSDNISDQMLPNIQQGFNTVMDHVFVIAPHLRQNQDIGNAYSTAEFSLNPTYRARRNQASS